MKLEEKMKKFPTIKGPNCKGCGNPWFFQKEQKTECTTCGREESVQPTNNTHPPHEDDESW